MGLYKPKVCCITGHKKIDKSKVESTKAVIREAVMQAIQEGYTHFISGFADGVDLYFAEIVVELKDEYHLSLEAVLPYPNRANVPKAAFQELLAQCISVNIVSERYFPACYMNRNRYMVDKSDLVITVYDGRQRGSTLFTMRYAHTLGNKIKVIHI